MRHTKIIYAGVVFMIAVGLAVSGVWYYRAHLKKTPQSTPTSSSQQATGQTDSNNSSPPSSGVTTPQTYPVFVYFSKHPDSDNDPSRTFPVNRSSLDLGVAKFAVGQLLKGPTTAESDQGYFTTAKLRSGTSTCGGSDFTVSITNGTATLQFCRPFDHRGVVADGQADSEIKATLRQFNSIQKVVILNSRGDCEFDLSGLNMCKQ